MKKSEEIWSLIKDKDINVFGMPQKVSDYCDHAKMDDNKCFLTCKAWAVLPALEGLLGTTYNCSQVEKYLVVEKK